MSPKKLSVKWSEEAISDLKGVYYDLLRRHSKNIAFKIREEIFIASRSIVFPEQFQIDDIYPKYRRIIIRNYKILYTVDKNIIHIIMVIDSRRNP